MLYVSTKDKTESFTAYRVLHADKSPDGGLFTPFHLPVFSEDDLEQIKELSFSETVAKILNLFFSRNLTGWDVEFSVGRRPFQIVNIGQRITVAELWHNNRADYDYMVSALYQKLSDQPCADVPQWVYIATEIAMLFGLYGELQRSGTEFGDVAITDHLPYYSVGAWYARKMGLPIGMILCGCCENSGLWDLWSRGEASPNVPEGMERLVYENFGGDVSKCFADARENGRNYRFTEDQTSVLRQGIHPSVIGNSRINAVMSSIQRTCGYEADSHTAAAYGAVQDYRAAAGENRPTLLLSRHRTKE